MNNSGLHIIADFQLCEYDVLINHELFIDTLCNIVKENGMTPLNYIVEYFGEYGNASFSLNLLLAESHCNFHTFALQDELLSCNMDIYTCSYTKDNSDGCKKIYEYIKNEIFKPKIIKQEITIKR